MNNIYIYKAIKTITSTKQKTAENKISINIKLKRAARKIKNKKIVHACCVPPLTLDPQAHTLSLWKDRVGFEPTALIMGNCARLVREWMS